jgi:N-acetylglutamate synthase-like GNAT family acetyltransferase
MAEEQGIIVRRAKPSDVDSIVALVNSAWSGEQKIDKMSVIERLGSVGFLIAERDSAIVGMLGWQAENLVVRLTDFLVGSVSDRFDVGQALLAEMEQAARELECEAILLFMPRPTPPALIEFWESLDYEAQIVADLPRAWQQAAKETQLDDNDTVVLKKLRERRVLRPM